MSREVRMVPSTWEHPKDKRYQGGDKHEPLYAGYVDALAKWEAMYNKQGLQECLDWFGHAPNKDEYMPVWPEEEKTHYMMYETCSEGTPCSPPMKTKEDLCQYLVDNKVSSFGRQSADYAWWWNVINGGVGMTEIAPGIMAI